MPLKRRDEGRSVPWPPDFAWGRSPAVAERVGRGPGGPHVRALPTLPVTAAVTGTLAPSMEVARINGKRRRVLRWLITPLVSWLVTTLPMSAEVPGGF